MRTTTFGLGALVLSLVVPFAPAQKASDFCPADSLVVVSIPNLGQTIDHVRAAVETVCAHPMLSSALQEGLEEMASEIGFNPLMKNTWRAMGVDVSRDAAFFMNMATDSDDDLEPLFGVIVPVTDQEALQGFLHQMMSRHGDRKVEWRAVDGLPGAVQPWMEGWDDEMRAEEMILAHKDGYAIIAGSDDDALVSAAARLALECQMGIASNSTWKTAQTRLGSSDVFASIHMRKIFEMATAQMDREVEEWRQRAAEAGEDEEWVHDVARSMEQNQRQTAWLKDLMGQFGDIFTMSLSASEMGVRLQGLMEGKDLAQFNQPRSIGNALNSVLAPSPLMMLRYAFNPNAIEGFFAEIPQDVLEEMDLDQIDQAIEMGNALLGIDLIEDVWKKFTGRLQVSVATPSDQLMQSIIQGVEEGDMDEETAMGLVSMADMTIAIEFSDTTAIVDMIDTLSAMAQENAPVAVNHREVGGHQAWFIGPSFNGEVMELGAVAIANNTLILGTALGINNALDRLVNGQGTPKVDHPLVQKGLGEPASTTLFVDLRPIHKFVKALSESMGEEELMIAEAVLMTMHSLSMYSSSEENVGYFNLEVRFN